MLIFLKNIFKKILDTLLPQKCVGCGEKGELLCTNCLEKVENCEKNLDSDTFAVFSYKNEAIRKAIKMMKYRGISFFANSLSGFAYETALEEISRMKDMENTQEEEKIILIPVPLHKNRLKIRGFNQSEEIAKGIMNKDKGISFVLVTDVLERIKETKSQVSVMNREKRLENLKGSFSVKNKEKIKNKTILLIDDVITTGATIEECRKTLKKAGAGKILALAIAH